MLKIVELVSIDEKIKHLEIVKKSYLVMLKSLQIRLELLNSKNQNDDFFRNVLHSKIKYYTMQVEEVESKLDLLAHEQA
jgi:hypothetical protein